MSQYFDVTAIEFTTKHHPTHGLLVGVLSGFTTGAEKSRSSDHWISVSVDNDLIIRITQLLCCITKIKI